MSSSAAVLADLPPSKEFMRILSRTRKTQTETPKNPEKIEELNITDEMKQVKYGKNGDDAAEKIEQFLFFDSGPTKKRILIFATENNLNFLKQCEFWHLDASFDTAPQFFQQLFVIHGEKKTKY